MNISWRELVCNNMINKKNQADGTVSPFNTDSLPLPNQFVVSKVWRDHCLEYFSQILPAGTNPTSNFFSGL